VVDRLFFSSVEFIEVAVNVHESYEVQIDIRNVFDGGFGFRIGSDDLMLHFDVLILLKSSRSLVGI
jgi:hypothetical protein